MDAPITRKFVDSLQAITVFKILIPYYFPHIYRGIIKPLAVIIKQFIMFPSARVAVG